ncbi:MAG TPA: amidohydrolase family protein [Planctomycetota bacterium]|nr:amidohydrolase family protein [Planctomycetota bacterium]
MDGRASDLRIFDAHTHFFSLGFFGAILASRAGERRSPTEFTREDLSHVLRPLGVEVPPIKPEALGDRWRDELDHHGVERTVLIASVPSDWPSVARAVRHLPDRFTGLAMVNPCARDAVSATAEALDEGGLRGVCLFPAMHRYRLSDDAARRVVEVAATRGALVFCHFGLLRVPIREKLGLYDAIDIGLANPLDLASLAADFPRVTFQIPHFGCGFLRETLLLGAQYPNVVIDTASSNSWIRLLPERLDLTRVIELALEAFGPERVLWGSDSSILPRGFRADLLASQLEAFRAAGASEEDLRLVFGGNARRIYGIEG